MKIAANMASILVVEDHAIFVTALVRLLHDRGRYEVTAVRSGEEALDQLPSDQFDLALLDVSLPGVNGIDLVSRIHERQPALPCLMVSGYMAPHYVNLSMAAGARGYVLKEDISGILEAIRQVLRGGTYVSHALQ
jgi:two-component system, NarL family, invasion response regulator UvrY